MFMRENKLTRLWIVRGVVVGVLLLVLWSGLTLAASPAHLQALRGINYPVSKGDVITIVPDEHNIGTTYPDLFAWTIDQKRLY